MQYFQDNTNSSSCSWVSKCCREERWRQYSQALFLFQCCERSKPRPSIYPLLHPKCPLFGAIYPYLRAQGGSWKTVFRCRTPGCVLSRRILTESLRLHFPFQQRKKRNPAQTLGARIPEGGGGSIYKHMYVYVYICYFAQDLNGRKLP